MNERVRLADRKELTADIDGTNGDLVYLKDNTLDLVLIDQPPLWELQVNRQVQGLELKMHEDRRGLLQTIARTRHFGGYAMGWELSVGRLMVPGQSSLHIQYRIKRVRLSERYPVPGPNPHESEMPLYLDTLGFLGWRFTLMREETRMRVAHLGAAGPAEHVGFDDGPIASVLPKVQHLMRRTYPGVMTIPGALYYNPSDETWFCVTSRRSKLAWTADFNEHGMQFFPQYHKLLEPDGEFYVPEFSIQWGRGRASMETFWNGFFDAVDWTKRLRRKTQPPLFSALAV